MKKYLGVIGNGQIFRDAYLPILPFIDDIETVLLYDPIHNASSNPKNSIKDTLSRENPSRYSHHFDSAEEKFMEFPEKIQIATDIDELCGNVDKAIILTPPNTHLELCKKLSQNNIKCLVEKPITNSLQEILTLTNDELSLMNEYVFYAESFIHTPFFKLLKDKISQLETINKFYMSFPHGGQNGDAYSNWRLNRNIAGGGVGMDWMIHMSGLSLYLTEGKDISSIENVSKRYIDTEFGEIDSYMLFTGSIQDKKGSIIKAKIEGSWGARSLLDGNQILFIEGKCGTIDVRHFRDNNKRKIYELLEKKNGVATKNSYKEEFPHDSFYYTLINFLNEKSDMLPYMNFQFGLEQFKLINKFEKYE